MRTLAFGDLATGVWGAAWVAGDGARPFACLGAPGAVTVPATHLEGAGSDAEWRLVADGTSLGISPLAEAVRVFDPDGATVGFEQLCRVAGRFTLNGTEHETSCLARRGERTESVEGLDSVRDVSALFEPDDGVALVSLRPRKRRGHDSDAITAAVLDAEASAPVADPRFSTTYGATGRPIRSSFELWLGEEETEYPRRAAGEALGPYASGVEGGVAVEASLFRWGSRGREGIGVYILAQPA
jgi:hypothetical protein